MVEPCLFLLCDLLDAIISLLVVVPSDRCSSRVLRTLNPRKSVKVRIINLLVGVDVNSRVGNVAIVLLRSYIHRLTQAWVLHEHKVVQNPESRLKFDQIFRGFIAREHHNLVIFCRLQLVSRMSEALIFLLDSLVKELLAGLAADDGSLAVLSSIQAF